MADGVEQSTAEARPSRGAVLGEAFRRFMLRPESTALAAVVILFIICPRGCPKEGTKTLSSGLHDDSYRAQNQDAP